jgi:hypothetical protein
LGRRTLDSSVDRIPLGDDDLDDRAGQLTRRRVGLGLGELALEDGRGSALAELRLEHRGKGDSPPGTLRPDPIGGPARRPLRHQIPTPST